MKEPFITVHSPWEADYQKRTRQIVLYSYFKSMEACDNCGSHDCRCGEDGEPIHNKESSAEYRHYNNIKFNRDQPELPRIPIKEMTIQKLIDMLPPDVSPSDVKMNIGTDMGDMGYYGQWISFYYEKDFPADPAQYKIDKAKYDAAWKVYEKEKKIYDKWKKDEEVKKLQNQIKQLKNSKNNDDF